MPVKVKGLLDLKLGRSNNAAPPIVVWTDVRKVNNFTINDPDTDDQDIEGDGTVETDTAINGYDGSFAAAYLDESVLDVLFAKPPATASLGTNPNGVAIVSRQGFGATKENNNPVIAAYCTMEGYDVDTGVRKDVGFFVPKLKANPHSAGEIQNRGIFGMEVGFTLRKTDVDILGAAIPGADPGGNYFFRDILAGAGV